MQAHVDELPALQAQKPLVAAGAAGRWMRWRAPPATRDNVFARVVEAAEAGCTHGEICGTLRQGARLRPGAGPGVRAFRADAAHPDPRLGVRSAA
jgi:methylmalonyl-CoA mutase N-terminal domain/subunit